MRHIKLLFAAAITMFLMNGLVFAQDTTLTVTSDGNVGIGTTNPTQKLVVEGFLRVAGSNRFMLGGPFSAEYLYNPNGTSLRIHVGNNDRITIANGGNVGIGTTSPTAKLHIGGTSGVDGIKFPDGTLQTTAATGGSGLWSASGSDIFYNSGNVGIGTNKR